MQQNNSFINNKCERCGKPDMVLSELRLVCNYGSKYDGESVQLFICGECADRVFEFIRNESGR